MQEVMEDVSGVFDYLESMGHLEGAALGIAKKYVVQGDEKMSDKQKYILKNFVLPVIERRCLLDDSIIPMSELIESLSNGGLCGYCAHMAEQHMKE